MQSKGKVLVTGADGFIESHLTEELVRRGYEVKAFVFYNSFNSWGWLDACDSDVAGNFEVFTGDIRDSSGVKSAMRGCDRVLHLASLIAIPYSYHSPETYLDTNIRGTLNVLQAAREHGVAKIVHTSTSEVYGTAKYVPIDEDHPLQGQSPYSASKIGADQLAYSFFTSFELPVAIARPFNTFGPRQSARAVIPTIITQIANNNTKLSLGSVTPTREFNYVSDTVNGFISMLDNDTIIGETINFGNGFEISIGELVKLISSLMNSGIEVQSTSERERPPSSEVARLVADNRKAKLKLNWEPKFAGEKGLIAGLEKTIEWFTDPGNLNRYKISRYNI